MRVGEGHGDRGIGGRVIAVGEAEHQAHEREHQRTERQRHAQAGQRREGDGDLHAAAITEPVGKSAADRRAQHPADHGDGHQAADRADIAQQFRIGVKRQERQHAVQRQRIDDTHERQRQYLAPRQPAKRPPTESPGGALPFALPEAQAQDDPREPQ